MLNWDDPLAKPKQPEPAAEKMPAERKLHVREPDAQYKVPAPVVDETLARVEAEEQAPAVKAKKKQAPVAEAKQPLVAEPKPMPVAAKPINPDDKRVVNGMADINQLAPFKYPWAWEYFLNANKNHWTPLDINMGQDITFGRPNGGDAHFPC